MPPPANPAPVSGPGPQARRTDGGPAQRMSQLTNAKYGEQATYQADQRGAPMASTPNPSPGTPPSEYPANPAAANVVPLAAPTQRPGEPVTAGANAGPGPGPEALGISPAQTEAQDMGDFANQYMSALEFSANMRGASPSGRQLVNLLKANSP